jgi:hypothetical protein
MIQPDTSSQLFPLNIIPTRSPTAVSFLCSQRILVNHTIVQKCLRRLRLSILTVARKVDCRLPLAFRSVRYKFRSG